MNMSSSLAPEAACQGDDNCPRAGKNELSADQDLALAPLNSAALAAGCDSIDCTRYALFTSSAGLQCAALTPSPRAPASEIDAFRAG